MGSLCPELSSAVLCFGVTGFSSALVVLGLPVSFQCHVACMWHTDVFTAVAVEWSLLNAFRCDPQAAVLVKWFAPKLSD